MKNLSKCEVPSGDVKAPKYVNGVIVAYSAGKERVLLIGHEKRVVTTTDERGEEKAEEKDYAFEVRVPMPVNRARAINAAEMAAYDLITAYDVASFNAGLSRKDREGVDKEEVREHDEFIKWVKKELTAIGI